MVEPVNVPRWVELAATPDSACRSSTFSASASAWLPRACSVNLAVLLASSENFPLVPAVKLPMWVSPLEMPMVVWVFAMLKSLFASSAVSSCCRACLLVWLSTMVEPVNVPRWVDPAAIPDRVTSLVSTPVARVVSVSTAVSSCCRDCLAV